MLANFCMITLGADDYWKKVPMLDFEMNEEGDYQYTTKVYEQPNKIGSIVLDFIQQDKIYNFSKGFKFSNSFFSLNKQYSKISIICLL